MNKIAANAFIRHNVEILALLARLRDASDNNFDVVPDAVTWGDVEMLKDVASKLREISDFVFNEGEYAR